MKKEGFEQRLAALRSVLAALDHDDVTPIDRLKQALLLTSAAVEELKADVIKNGFKSEDEEIHFFKFVKPAFMALQIYELDRYALMTNLPVGTNEMVKQYIEQELLYIIRFFRLNAFHYQYFQTGARELDQQYFTRDGKPGEIPILDFPDPFPGFSAPLDYLFSKFIAYQRMQHDLIDQLGMLISNNSKPVKSVPKLKWTGDTINLVEIAYGIWLTNQVNNGQASMSEITRWLEEIFGVHIGDPNRRWQDITRRKSISPTKYLELSIAEINKRIDNERSLSRQKRRPVKS